MTQTPPSSPIDLDGWEPVDEILSDTLTPAVAARLHGLLDAPGPPPADGDDLPPLWHWMAWLPQVPQAGLGPDGHPRKGGFLPPVPLPRRMFVGGELRLPPPGSVTVGAPLTRHGRVGSVEAKAGGSGPLVFVSVDYRVGGRGAAIEELQRLVYREAAAPGASPAPAPPAPPARGPADAGWTMGLDLPIDPVMLFRFSALTYNAHRIHYDREWATGEEGYPGLVVHGPLQAIGLAELCRRDPGLGPLRSFRFRAVRPAFDDGPVLLRGRRTDDGTAELVAFDHHGHPTMRATASFES